MTAASPAHAGGRPARPPTGGRATLLLHEQVRGFLRHGQSLQSPVDREGGFIRDVRVLGLVSENGRRYTAEAAHRAMGMYEGRKVKVNHPQRPHDTRPVQTVFGWLEGIYQGDGGALYARKLHFLKSHEMAAAVCEAAERNPALFSLSHNAEGRGRYEGNVFIVEEITEVRSVDIVDDGATNRTLFEGKTMGLTLSQLIASSHMRDSLKRTLLEMGAYCEDGQDPLGDMPVAPAGGEVDLDGGGGDGAADWKADVVAAIGKLVQSEDPEQHALGLKLMRVLRPGTKEPAEEGEEMPDANSPAEEGRRRRAGAAGASPLTEGQALALCKSAGIEPTVDLLEAIKGATFDQSLSIINLAKKSLVPAVEPARPRASAPRSSGPRAVVPISEGVLPKDAKGWASQLLK